MLYYTVEYTVEYIVKYMVEYMVKHIVEYKIDYTIDYTVDYTVSYTLDYIVNYYKIECSSFNYMLQDFIYHFNCQFSRILDLWALGLKFKRVHRQAPYFT